MQASYQEYAWVFQALSDEKRLSILEMLHDRERCAHDLLDRLDISQSTLSYHMKILCRSGIVVGRQVGKWMYYRISEEGSAHACRILHSMTFLCPEGTEASCPEVRRTPVPQSGCENGKEQRS